MLFKNKKSIFKAKSILAYAIGIATILIIVVVSNQLQEIESVFVQNAILGAIFFLGYASAALLLIEPFPQLEEGEIKLLAEEGKQGKTRFIINDVFSKGFLWIALAIITFFLLRDYFRESSLINNLGWYAALILLFIFVRLRLALSYWKEIEKAYKSLI